MSINSIDQSFFFHLKCFFGCLLLNYFFITLTSAEGLEENALADSRFQEIQDEVWAYYRRDFESAIEWADSLLKYARETPSQIHLAKAYNTKGAVLYGHGEFQKAISHHFNALEINKTLGDSNRIARNYNNLALAHYELGNLEYALNYNLTSLEIKQSLGDSIGIGNSYNNIGMVYDALEEYEKALENYERSLEINSRLENTEALPVDYNNIGTVHLEKGNTQEARRTLEKAIELNEEIENEKVSPDFYINLGISYLKQESFEEAEKNFRKSLAKDKDRIAQSGVARSYYYLGNNFFQQNQYDSSIYYLKKSESIATELGMAPRLTETYGLLSQSFEKQGESDSALAYHQKYASWKDSLWEEKNKGALQQARAQFETEEKERELELLEEKEELQQARIEQQNFIIYLGSAGLVMLALLLGLLFYHQNRIKRAKNHIESKNTELRKHEEAIARQNEDLKKLNEDKNHFIRVLAHDLRHPLSHIQGLADILLMDPKNLSAEQKENLTYIKEANNHASNMISKLLDINAIENETIQPQFEETNVQDLLEKLEHQYRNTAQRKSIGFKWDLQEGLPTIDTDPYYCRQIFDNLINNALKYSPQESTVFIKAQEKADGITIAIEDEGPGIPEEDQKNLFKKFQKLSTKPTGNEPSTGLGLSIVKKYVQSIGGDVWYQKGETTGGGCFVVKLPKEVKASA